MLILRGIVIEISESRVNEANRFKILFVPFIEAWRTMKNDLQQSNLNSYLQDGCVERV